MPSAATSDPSVMIERWRCPAAPRAKSAVIAGAGAPVALVFFPPWFAIPVAVGCAAWGLSMAALGTSVTVDQSAGLLVLRMGFIVRRIKLTDVRAVLVERAKLSVSYANRGEVSIYAWRKDMADRLLGVPVVAGDIGHAIAKAVAIAQDGTEQAGAPQSSARTRSRLATALLGGAGVIAIASALLVRVHWHNPVLTVVSVILAVWLGVCGLAYLLIAAWILLTGRAPHILADQ